MYLLSTEGWCANPLGQWAPCRAHLDAVGHFSSLSPTAQGQTNPHGTTFLLQRSLSCSEALAVARLLSIPSPAPAHHGLGIMELSMDHILLWITLKAEGNKRESLPLPVSERFPNLPVNQVWEKKAKNPLCSRKFKHLTTLSPHLLNLT